MFGLIADFQMLRFNNNGYEKYIEAFRTKNSHPQG